MNVVKNQLSTNQDVKFVKTVEIVNVDKMINRIKNRLKYFYYLYLANRIDRDLAIKLIVSKQLEKYNVDMQYVIDNPKIEGKDWYIYYTFDTEKEFEDWKKFSLKIIKKVYPRADENWINKEFSMLNLMWGLKTLYDRSKNCK